jgi:hypothetical protein
MDDELRDRLAIRELIESWAIWRDSGDFERLRTCYHDDGRMHATWFQGTADEFVARARASWARGNMSSHALGAIHVDLAGSRAVAQTRLTLSSRDEIDGVLLDIVCVGRFYDLLEKRQGRWAIAERRLTYEKDHAIPVIPGMSVTFDHALLDAFPQGYRFLAYAQTKRGLDVYRDLPGLRGPEVEALYDLGRRWLEGG